MPSCRPYDHAASVSANARGGRIARFPWEIEPQRGSPDKGTKGANGRRTLPTQRGFMSTLQRDCRSFIHHFFAITLPAGLAITALSLSPRPAWAEEPQTAPTVDNAPSDGPSEAPAQVKAPRPLPPAVLAMRGHDVILRLEGGSLVEGHLLSIDADAFTLRVAGGSTIRILRRSVRGVRLVDAADREPVPPPSTPSMDMPPSSELPPLTLPKKERSVGFGTAFGGGFAAAGDEKAPALLLPTLELQIFTPREFSIDLTLPVFNMVLGSALTKGMVLGADMFFNVNAGSGRARFVAGPGIGFAYASVGNITVTAVKLPAQIGFEVLSKKRTFGFKLLARPWVEFAQGDSASGVGGGLLGALVFSGYSLSDRAVE